MKNKTHMKEEVKGRIKNIKNMDTENTDTTKLRQEEKDIVNLARKCIQDSRDQKISNKERTVLLEDALKLLITLWTKARKRLCPSTFTVIAEAYLLRSRIFRPKGVNVPGKKREAIRKGIEFVNKAILKEPTNTDASRTLALHYLEQEMVDTEEIDKSKLKKALKEALNKECTRFNESIDDVNIAIRYAELEKSESGNLQETTKNYLERVIQSEFEDTEWENGILLKKAKAYYLLGNDAEVKKNIRIFSNQLVEDDIHFAHPLWSEVVAFIKELKDSGKEYWKEVTLCVYDACHKQEKETATLSLRWYWSQLRLLYDLAFIAADSLQKKAEIADSLKTRPPLHIKALEELGKKYINIKDIVEANYRAVYGYIKKAKKLSGMEHEKEVKAVQRDIEDVKDWVVIHFYINQYEQNGYAIVYDGYSKKWDEDIKVFSYGPCFRLTRKSFVDLTENGVANDIIEQLKSLEDIQFSSKEALLLAVKNKIGTELILQYAQYTNLFEMFLRWQINYRTKDPKHVPEDREECAQCLEELCIEIGKVMPFLFDIPVGNRILFIPHSFLSQMPLHGAINESDEPLVTKNACSYLPAGSFASKNNRVNNGTKYLLKNFEDPYYQKLKDVIKDEIKNEKKWSISDPAVPKDLLEIPETPGMLIVLSHGIGDPLNPSNSGLLLDGGNVTPLDIMSRESLKLNGCRVVVGCCEADLFPLSEILDEHVSVASAFLFKNASEVLCTMWEVNPKKIERILIERCKSDKGLFEGISEWQKSELSDWKSLDEKDAMIIYDTLVFRTLGGL